MASLLQLVFCILGASSLNYASKIHAIKQNVFNEIVLPVVDSYIQDGMILENVEDVSSLLGLKSDQSFQNVRDLLRAHGIGVLDKPSIFSIYALAQFFETDAVINVLSSAPSYSDFIERARILRVYVNPGLYNYALRSAIVNAENDPQYNNIHIPDLFRIAARSFFTDEAIYQAIQRSRRHISADDNTRSVGNSDVPESSQHYLGYFREDIGLNAFHHTILLQTMPHANAGEFINARYNAERFALGLSRVKPMPLDKRMMIAEEGYDSHLSSYTGEKRFAARADNMGWNDDIRDLLQVSSVSEIPTIYSNLLSTIRSGYFTDVKGHKVPLTAEELAKTSKGLYDRTKRSCINPQLYGKQSLGMLGHRLLSVVTDPDGRYNQEPGVIGTLETALRDPVAYQWHEALNNLNKEYLLTLPSYSAKDLEAPVRIESVTVQIDDQLSEENTLETFMEGRTVDISMDPSIASEVGKDSGPVQVPIKRLNHKPFHYHINLNNKRPQRDFTAAVRIFIAPRLDETGDQFKSLNEQQQFMIEMDKFVVKLNPGENRIRRSSELSSFSHPVLLTSEEQLQYQTEAHNRRLHCGWPLNLLVPRGTTSGMDFDLFVMVSDWTKDHSAAVDDGVAVNLDRGVALCGVEGSRSNPDGRPYLFPFDRKFQESSLSECCGKHGNMMQSKITIRHMSE